MSTYGDICLLGGSVNWSGCSHSIALNPIVHLCTCNSSFVAVNLTATAQLQRIKCETIVHLLEIQLGSKYMLFWRTPPDMTDYQ